MGCLRCADDAMVHFPGADGILDRMNPSEPRTSSQAQSGERPGRKNSCPGGARDPTKDAVNLQNRQFEKVPEEEGGEREG